MGLLFCCPSCGTDLRVHPSAAVLVSCPGCGEAVRVPRRPHPREAATDTPTLPLPLREAVTSGLSLLRVSVWAFATAAVCVATSFLLRVTIGHPDEYPIWLPPVQVALGVWWLVSAGGGCVLRLRGYLRCRPAGDRYALGGWVVAATVGASLSAAGVLAVVPLVIGRPVITLLPPAAGGFILIGLSAGLVGVLLEFAFVSVMNRLLWETAGWQASAHTGRYAVAVVGGAVGVMACLCLGVVALVATGGGNDVNTDAAGVSVPAKVIAAVVVVAVTGIGGWLTWRFARLLRITREAVTLPEPTPDRTPA